ncbi:unnamed protein product [Lactuca virosa]|uniref:Uncharacterized protein n=1 Tax=Lactuca virosa TaxID=75947 RepID=A0AAU9MFI8_9ASTR|nr:unnamed protein product [Lactuca virosa]
MTPFTIDFLQPHLLLLSSNISRSTPLLPCRTTGPEDLLKIDLPTICLMKCLRELEFNSRGMKFGLPVYLLMVVGKG